MSHEARPRGPHHDLTPACCHRGYGAERVLHAQAAGIFHNLHSIAVEAGEAVAEIETPDGQRLPVVTQISGILCCGATR